ncbi:hypothetical protein EW146_g5134 [Bondarzewia mesenterica]|uniref:CENP-V/GFA domain-containing protein n=1 Tax=Bondarzewia mesenterica TaxID=1095465 RepID=A0A4S4LU70_9AGAM|nr:hypothetical protein EW146_g5134 [Bondarzewia mesenterica]
MEHIIWMKRDTLKEYASSDPILRGFCLTCGSSMYWFTKPQGPLFLAVGTLDEDVLLGPDGPSLCTPVGGRIFCANDIKGVTSSDGAYGGGPSSKEAGPRCREWHFEGKSLEKHVATTTPHV